MSWLPNKPVKYRSGGMVKVPHQSTFTTMSTAGDTTVFVPKSQNASVIEKPRVRKSKGGRRKK